MSRTKGVDSEIRHVHDEYITPPWCVRRLLEKYTLRPGQIILDPCASRGELLLEVKMNRPDLVLAGIEINSTCAISLAQVVGPNVICPQDFLKIPFPSVPGRSLTVLTNPPYCLAQEFVEHSLRFAEIAIMLLRLNFLGGRDRREFTARTNPGIFALPNRPCFNGYGSDACEYGWFVYGDPHVAGRWAVLDNTPEAEIKDWNRQMRARYPKPTALTECEHIAPVEAAL